MKAEAETKLKQQQNLYEAVRSDRNLYSKNLIECQDEITEMKRKLKIMNHQIDQLKEEITTVFWLLFIDIAAFAISHSIFSGLSLLGRLFQYEGQQDLGHV